MVFLMEIKGKAHKYGDDVDTDVIIPARYLNTSEPKVLAKHCLENLDKEFVKKVSPGDILVAGKNFGCGSSREHAPLAIKAAGINCIIAESFANIFYRNSINIGLFVFICPQGTRDIQDGDKIAVNPVSGKIKNISQNKTYQLESFPPFMQEIIKARGLVNKIKQKYRK